MGVWYTLLFFRKYRYLYWKFGKISLGAVHILCNTIWGSRKTPPCNIVINRKDPPHLRLRNIWTAPYKSLSVGKCEKYQCQKNIGISLSWSVTEYNRGWHIVGMFFADRSRDHLVFCTFNGWYVTFPTPTHTPALISNQISNSAALIADDCSNECFLISPITIYVNAFSVPACVASRRRLVFI